MRITTIMDRATYIAALDAAELTGFSEVDGAMRVRVKEAWKAIRDALVEVKTRFAF